MLRRIPHRVGSVHTRTRGEDAFASGSGGTLIGCGRPVDTHVQYGLETVGCTGRNDVLGATREVETHVLGATHVFGCIGSS